MKIGDIVICKTYGWAYDQEGVIIDEKEDLYRVLLEIDTTVYYKWINKEQLILKEKED